MESLKWQVKLVFVCSKYPGKPFKGRQKDDMIMIMFEESKNQFGNILRVDKFIFSVVAILLLKI